MTDFNKTLKLRHLCSQFIPLARLFNFIIEGQAFQFMNFPQFCFEGVISVIGTLGTFRFTIGIIQPDSVLRRIYSKVSTTKNLAYLCLQDVAPKCSRLFWMGILITTFRTYQFGQLKKGFYKRVMSTQNHSKKTHQESTYGSYLKSKGISIYADTRPCTCCYERRQPNSRGNNI